MIDTNMGPFRLVCCFICQEPDDGDCSQIASGQNLMIDGPSKHCKAVMSVLSLRRSGELADTSFF